MSAGFTETIAGCLVRRTGWTTSHRRCPVHSLDLELCFDETDYSTWTPEHQAPFNHDDNRVRWRCSACCGSWLENQFLLPRRGLRERLLLKCPSCSSVRVSHDCVPECCGSHTCIDCGASFDLVVELEGPATKARVEEAEAVHLNMIVRTRDQPADRDRSGWHRDYRRCPEHGSSLELVFVSVYGDLPAVLAWRCPQCALSLSEPCFQHARWYFVPDVTPAAVCPSCKEGHLVSPFGTSDTLAKCLECGATARLKLTRNSS